MNLDDLLDIMPHANQARAQQFFPFLDAAMREFEIDTAGRQAAFIPNVAHESAMFTRLSESLNYRPEAILATFNTAKIRRFTPEQAQRFGRTPERPADQEMIANIAYANRMGNGDIASGDGWRNRGAGLIQTTGENNHRHVSEHFGIPRSEVGEWLRNPEGACRSAGLFWRENGCNDFADICDFDGVCDVINRGHKTERVGDAFGYRERAAYWERAKAVLV